MFGDFRCGIFAKIHVLIIWKKIIDHTKPSLNGFIWSGQVILTVWFGLEKFQIGIIGLVYLLLNQIKQNCVHPYVGDILDDMEIRKIKYENHNKNISLF